MTFPGAQGKVLIAVVDSGWDPYVSEPGVLPGASFVDEYGRRLARVQLGAPDFHGHGTACIDIILRECPHTTIVPLKVFGRKLRTSMVVVAEAIDYAVRYGADIINLSLGSTSQVAIGHLYRACSMARSAGVILIAAAGGGGNECYPAYFDNVFGVRLAGPSQTENFVYSPEDDIELSCKGHQLLARSLGGGQQVYSGVSFAAARMSGILARRILENPLGTHVERLLR